MSETVGSVVTERIMMGTPFGERCSPVNSPASDPLEDGCPTGRASAGSHIASALTIPPPRKFAMPHGPERELAVLHWLPDQGRWEPIDRQSWRGFRHRGETLPNLTSGVHYFIVCASESGVPVNLIPHKYLIEQDGTIGRDDDGLSGAEFDDYWVLTKERTELNPVEEARLNEIHKKIDLTMLPPKESLAALTRSFRMSPKPGSDAERFFKDYSL